MLLVHFSPKKWNRKNLSFFVKKRNDDLNPSLSSSQGEEVNVANKKKNCHDFEDDTPPSNHRLPPSNHRLLVDSLWEKVDSFPPVGGSFRQDGSQRGCYRVSMSGDGSFLAAAPYSDSESDTAYQGIVQFSRKKTKENGKRIPTSS